MLVATVQLFSPGLWPQNPKEKNLSTHFQMPQVFGDIDSAEQILVGWGSTKGAALFAQSQLEASGKQMAYVHFTHMYPLNYEKLQEFFTPERLAKASMVEQNSHAQFARLLRQETGISIENALLRFDGRPIVADDIIQFVSQQS